MAEKWTRVGKKCCAAANSNIKAKTDLIYHIGLSTAEFTFPSENPDKQR